MNARHAAASLAVFLCLPVFAARAADGDPAAGKRNTITCNGCHGQSSMKNVPLLGGQNPVYFAIAMRAYQDGLRAHATMRDVAKGFGDRDYRNFGAWYAQPGPDRSAPRDTPAPEKASRCATCHGADGFETVTPDIPRIAGQRTSFLTTALREYRDGTRKNAVMGEQAKDLTDEDIAALATHYGAQPGLFLR